MVYSCMIDGWSCAMKEFELDEFEPLLLEGILREISLLESLPYHRNLVRYLFHQTTENKVRLFMAKYATNLTNILKRMRKEVKFFSEYEIVRHAADLIRGIDVLHQHNIMHRDLKVNTTYYKPNSCQSDNIFVTLNSHGDIDCLSIGDFDTAKRISIDSSAKTVIGTPGYIAPEILKSRNKKEYSFSVDSK